MEKSQASRTEPLTRPKRTFLRTRIVVLAAFLLCLFGLYQRSQSQPHLDPHQGDQIIHSGKKSSYGKFPQKDDPFQFIPCTSKTIPPALDDQKPQQSWAKLFDKNPKHWSWGNETDADSDEQSRDPYAGRGIYLCGYLDVPLDYTNKTDPRIARLAVTKYQVSGLKRTKGGSRPGAGKKSARTIVVEPGGPGGSGTSLVWRASEKFSKRLSGNTFDVLGWDPRGVNTTQPAMSCFSQDARRDRWALITNQYREVFNGDPRPALAFADSMNEATFKACHELHGDIPRFLTTAFVARDVERIRIALGEEELTAHMISYGTGIAQTYANMFPQSVGRIIMDGTEYVRDQRKLGGFGLAALDNVTAAWNDGVLGECISAGPEHCALAKIPPGETANVTLPGLQKRMKTLLDSVLKTPIASYTKETGPAIIAYSQLVGNIYSSLYSSKSWPALAEMLQGLETGNTTLAAQMLSKKEWVYDPTDPAPRANNSMTSEAFPLILCGDSADDPVSKTGLMWWDSLWRNMTAQDWIAGNDRFLSSLPCRHFNTFWPTVAEVYRGELNNTLKHPVLLIAETYDPATPLRNGRRLLKEMGSNARLIAHHGYGHSSSDESNCTDAIAKKYILEGVLPKEPETACYANEKPYRYGVKDGKKKQTALEIWSEHVEEMAILNPNLIQAY